MTDSTVRIHRVFVLFMGALVFFGGFLLFFSEAQLSEQEFFSYALESQNINWSYPPFINQSSNYENVEEVDGSLELIDSAKDGYYSSNVSGNSSIAWETFHYDADISSGSPTVIIATSDYSDFREVKETETYDLRNGNRLIDISDYQRSKYLRWTLSFGTECDMVMNSVDIYGVDNTVENRYTSWLLVFLVVTVLMTMSFMFYGVLKVWAV